MAEQLTVQQLAEKQFTAFEEYKRINDARIDEIKAQKYAPSDTVEKLAKCDADITSLSKQLSDAMLTIKRPNIGEKGKTPDQEEHKEAFAAYLRKGVPIPDGLEKKAMNSTSDPDGGYLVPVDMEMMIERVVPTISAMARLAKTITIGSRSHTRRVKTSGMAMARVGEGQTAGETTEPVYSRLEFVVHPAEVEPWVYNETLEDADIDLASDLADEAAIGFAEGGAAEFITGNGVGRARGITAYSNVANASYAWGSVGYMPSGKSAAFASVAPADYFVNLQHALKSQYRSGASWLMSDSTLGTCRQFKDSSGSYYLWNPDPSAGPSGRFLGSPVEIDDNFAAIAANSYSLAYGNFARAYLIVNRTGTTLIRDNITAKGTTKFNFRRRFGGGVYNFEALKLMKFATS